MVSITMPITIRVDTNLIEFQQYELKPDLFLAARGKNPVVTTPFGRRGLKLVNIIQMWFHFLFHSFVFILPDKL